MKYVNKIMNKMIVELGLRLTTSGVFCLFLFLMLRGYLVVLEVFVFFGE